MRASLVRLFLLSLALPLASATALVAPVLAQTTPPAVAAFGTALERGDASGLRPLLAERLLVSIDGDSRVYSREQALHVLGRFLRDRPASAVVFDAPRETGTDALFAAGRYRSDGETFVVRVLFGTRGGRLEAREVRIDQGRLE